MNKMDTAFAASDAAIVHSRISVGNRIPELDGARGVAVLAVLIGHYFGEGEHAIYSLRYGWMGVNLFFVLSGFLIGSIILERKDSPNFVTVFYTRRALRILPAYFATVAATLGFIWLYGPSAWIDPPLPTASYFTFTQNLVMAWSGGMGTLWLLPTWSLTVEEQFYLAVPLLMMCIPARALLPAIITGIVLGLLTRSFLYANGADIPARMQLFSNGHVLLLGVLIAYVHHRSIKVPEIVLRLIPLAPLVAFVTLIFAMGQFLLHVFLDLVPTLFASYILLAVQGWAGLRFLRAKILQAFGTISYCLYLIHQPINGVLHGLIFDSRPDIGTTQQILVTVAAVVVSVCIAALSWIAIERPLLRMGRCFAYSPVLPDLNKTHA
ncbi:acyltransferase family protein [Bradyrhizobium sp. USDA 4454]